MPKPIFNDKNNRTRGYDSAAACDGVVVGEDNGSGMHTSINLWNDGSSDSVTKKKNNNIFMMRMTIMQSSAVL
jgi:glutamine synthetase